MRPLSPRAPLDDTETITLAGTDGNPVTFSRKNRQLASENIIRAPNFTNDTDEATNTRSQRATSKSRKELNAVNI